MSHQLKDNNVTMLLKDCGYDWLKLCTICQLGDQNGYS